jgi:hypothetical protein
MSTIPSALSDAQAPSLPAAEPIPTRIEPRYEVLAQLGRGGMGVVYRVRDPSLGVELALKQLTMDPQTEQGREAAALFEREFHTLAQLSHPNMIRVYDYGLDAAGPYYTMELLDGGDLSELAPLPVATACGIMVRICSSLSLLHSRRLLHRDLSPRNIRCTRDGGAKLIDFGAMVPMGPGGQAVGTPAFVAPEVVHRLALDARSDLFSLGATLYYALTRRPPYVARRFRDLPEAWTHEPLPASQLAPDVPPALDALLAALLQVDPAHRPGSAFEVMQRLAVIAGIEEREPEDISRAYLATPTLVGRERELDHFEHYLRAAVEGRGVGVSFEAAAGLGRSRLLDSCVLRAKTLGASVLRLSGNAVSNAGFASAHELVDQLLTLLPETSRRVAQSRQLFSVLFTYADEPLLRPLAEWKAERSLLISALSDLIRDVSRAQPLMIAADDAELLDEASLALLASLAHQATGLRLIVAITVRAQLQPGQVPSLDVLRAQCRTVVLSPLSAESTEVLFSSVFGNVPHVRLLSDRIHQIACGNAGEALALAQVLLDRQQVRYVDGSWTLPAELRVDDLPANAEAALAERLLRLAPFSRRLAEIQALALPGAWTRADYVRVAGSESASRVDVALNELLWLDVLSSDGAAFSLSRHRVRAYLVSQLSAADEIACHRALAQRSAGAARASLAEVYHLLRAGALDLALDRFQAVVREGQDGSDFWFEPGIAATTIAEIVVRAYEASVALDRPWRERFELARHLTGLSITADTGLHALYGAIWLAQLKQDSGLAAYPAADSGVDPALRLQTAVKVALARYDATPARERVYRVDEAVGHLARYVTFSIAIGARTRDAALLGSLPAMLEPFIGFSAVLRALWQNAIAAAEMNYLGRTHRARLRSIEVYDQLGTLAGDELQYGEAIRRAIANALGSIEIGVGYPSAERWLALLDRDPLQRVNLLYLRRLLLIQDGDREGAERLRKQAEILSVHASARQVFMPPLRIEIMVQYRVADLAGLKHVYDQVARLALDWPGWLPQKYLALGYYERLRGDMPAAKQAFDECFEAAGLHRSHPPPCNNSWAAAAAGYIAVLIDLDRAEEARAFGLAALERCAALEIDTMRTDISRELALAEAKVGDLAGAVRRIESVIEEHKGMVEAHRIDDYEARARIAIAAQDVATVTHYVELLARTRRPGRGSLARARFGRLVDEGRRAGMQLTGMASAFDTSAIETRVEARRSAVSARAVSELRSDDSSESRAQHALDLLCGALKTSVARLYVADATTLAVSASRGEHTPELDARVAQYWGRYLAGDDFATVQDSELRAADGCSEFWAASDGVSCQPLLLSCRRGGSLVGIGVLVYASDAHSQPEANAWELATAISARLLELGDVIGVVLAD